MNMWKIELRTLRKVGGAGRYGHGVPEEGSTGEIPVGNGGVGQSDVTLGADEPRDQGYPKGSGIALQRKNQRSEQEEREPRPPWWTLQRLEHL